ncbi:protein CHLORORESPIRATORY REDUCTION 6, chloroplastic-like [Salvia hispanica]|uniref:protein CHLORORESPIRATORY REDUCTION 6, chloroplastic-like n=1 Tax=Salvia hispanica TaxID=49212 RepID=UPI0020097A54|nr:protein CHLORORESPIRATORY REDUCTION 6, chloroplastic-like [Salvia hispanica]
MAASIRPLYPPSCPLKHSSSSSQSIIKSHSPFSLSESHRSISISTSVSFNPSGNYDLSLFEEEDATKAPPPMPPKQGRFEVVIDNDAIARLDLSPFHAATGVTSAKEKAEELLERSVGFTINYVRADENDPRELSEFPEIRLWFVRLDAVYPWLPLVLDWRAGELARYAAMLVPHQMSLRMGVVFNPEALELFVVQKVFVVYTWLKENDVAMPRLKAKDMARMLGFGIGDDLFDLVDQNPL